MKHSNRLSRSLWLRFSTALLMMACASFTLATPREIPDARILEQNDRSKVFSEYTVHFSVFNSAFVPASVAEIYNITRGKNRVLINISVTKTGGDASDLGLPATVSGTATNLIQQQQVLDFQTISEGEATYFIAELKHTNEEVYNFAINVTPKVSDKPLHVAFSRKLYIKDKD
ncbi:DUF4426 domain-containing protein [Gilvimarinus sp. SDUM040013]|uniref:DUF4426 domain-containing protein n=1 Tax=Gilvimarinus gilvus TaxID=3058038 RepID=A0ABU4S2U3_9GAMM|nr:DUF4426 domain-containing protein [Gilvimarinus sp. SDUM040013]MDO3387602.1 DUF4426 domain-containing protein [Gilvimarinus sp. SDUM040013]MDX6850133.1 DUF4426 domain-containing protein [Gilvimarinus sp. SDUM040013]